MSLCIRTISSKLPSIVNTRKHVSRLDRHLPKHLTSPFLEEFLGCRTATETSKSAKRQVTDFVISPNFLVSKNEIYQNRILESEKSTKLRNVQSAIDHNLEDLVLFEAPHDTWNQHIIFNQRHRDVESKVSFSRVKEALKEKEKIRTGGKNVTVMSYEDDKKKSDQHPNSTSNRPSQEQLEFIQKELSHSVRKKSNIHEF